MPNVLSAYIQGMNNELNSDPSPVEEETAVGFVSPERVRATSFAIMTVLIVTAVIGGILMVWDLATQDTFWRLMASNGLIAGGVCAFSIVNTIFGKRLQTP